ncbi:MAG: type II secretion system protein GspE, partial [Bdellovibrionales bacterium]|nr:type II secretion system protein GspE [Bdellovibrionales bacterium]
MATHNYETLLVKGTGISSEQLRSLLKVSDRTGRPIKEALEAKTYHTPEEALAELCDCLGVAFMKEIPYGDIPVDLIRDIPINYAKENEVLPFRLDADSLTVLASNPLNLMVLDDLRVLFDRRIEVKVTTSSKIQDAINRVYEKSTAALEGLDDIESEEYD